MSVFDYLTCKYPLPGVPDAELLDFQTKDMPEPWQNTYEIRRDGTLWFQNYDVEDRSDPNAEGLVSLIGKATRVNSRWEFCKYFSGEIYFYDGTDGHDFFAIFVDGKLTSVHKAPCPWGTWGTWAGKQEGEK
jgi:hypothetical protein